MLLLATRFLLELVGLGAVAFVGATAPSEAPWRVALGIGGPFALAVVWGLVAAPKADNPLPRRARGLIGTAILVGIGVALVLAGQPGWGIAFAVAVLVNQALILVLGLDGHVAAIGTVGSRGIN